MLVTIKLVGIFRTARFDEEAREYPPNTCVSAVVEEISIPKHLLGIVLINDIHAGMDAVLNDGDTLCLLPLLGGG